MNMAANGDLVSEAMLEDLISHTWPAYPCLYNDYLRVLCHEMEEKLGKTSRLKKIKFSIIKFGLLHVLIWSSNVASATKSPLAAIFIRRISNTTHASWCEMISMRVGVKANCTQHFQHFKRNMAMFMCPRPMARNKWT